MITIERALKTDVEAIVALLADDPLGARRETPDDLSRYTEAFEVIDADPHQYLAVARRNGRVVGTLQLTVVPGLSRQGATRAQIEAVRVHADERGGGLGSTLLEWAEREAQGRGCVMLQLPSDAKRQDAHRFYQRLGYEPSHIGFKKRLV